MGDCLYALPGQMSVALQAAPHATHAHNRNWRQRLADGVNEQRTWFRFLLLVARCFRSLLRFFHIYIYYTHFCSSTLIIISLWLTFPALFLEYLTPIVLHADHCPTILLGEFQRFFRTLHIIELTHGVIVEQQQTQRGTRRLSCKLEHWNVPV